MPMLDIRQCRRHRPVRAENFDEIIRTATCSIIFLPLTPLPQFTQDRIANIGVFTRAQPLISVRAASKASDKRGHK